MDGRAWGYGIALMLAWASFVEAKQPLVRPVKPRIVRLAGLQEPAATAEPQADEIKEEVKPDEAMPDEPKDDAKIDEAKPDKAKTDAKPKEPAHVDAGKSNGNGKKKTETPVEPETIEAPSSHDRTGPPAMPEGDSPEMASDQPDGGCDKCWTGCEPRRDLWGRAEYLVWWVQGGRTPVLVTTSPEGTDIDDAGVLPGAQILFGGEREDTDVRSGGRFSLGYWFDPCERYGIEASTFVLEHSGLEFSASSEDTPILARPFNDVTNGFPGIASSGIVAFPDVLDGAILVRSTTRVLGAEVNARRTMWNNCRSRMGVLVGYRFFRLNDGLRIDEVTLDPSDVQIAATDSFDTENEFHGGQLGLTYEIKRGCWSLDLAGKIAYGGMGQRVTINGSTSLTAPDSDPDRDTGGILALDSNIGSRARTRFSVIPELNVNLVRHVSENCKLTLGYTFLFVSDVVRAGDQIDTNIDTDLFPPPIDVGTSPAFRFVNSDVWLQGLSLGFELKF